MKTAKNKTEQQIKESLSLHNSDSTPREDGINSVFASTLERLSVLSRISGEISEHLSNAEILEMLAGENSENLWPSDWILKAQLEFKAGDTKRCLESIDKAMAGFLKSSEDKDYIYMRFANLYGLFGEYEKALEIIKDLPARHFRNILLFDVDLLVKTGAKEILLRDADCMTVCCSSCVRDYLGLLSVYKKLDLEDKFESCLQDAVTAANDSFNALDYALLAFMLKILNRDGIDKYLALAGEFARCEYDSIELAFLHLLISGNRNTTLECVRSTVELEGMKYIFGEADFALNFIGEYLLEREFLTLDEFKRLEQVFYSVILEGMGDIDIVKYIERYQSYESTDCARKLFLTLNRHEDAAKCLFFMQEKTENCNDLHHCITVYKEAGLHSEATRCLNEIRKLAVNVSDYCTYSRALAVLGNTEEALRQADIAEKKASNVKDLETCLKLWFDFGTNDGVRRCKRKMQKLASRYIGLFDPLSERLDEFTSILKSSN